VVPRRLIAPLTDPRVVRKILVGRHDTDSVVTWSIEQTVGRLRVAPCGADGVTLGSGSAMAWIDAAF